MSSKNFSKICWNIFHFFPLCMRLQNEPTNRKPKGKIWFLKDREITRSFLRDAFPSCFRDGNERSCFRHISVITFPFFLVSVTFQVTNFFLFLTHVQDRMINVSENLPLRTIKVNKGKFTLEIGL